MRDLNNDFSDFTRTIVLNDAPSSQIDATYPNYSLAIAIEVYRNNYRGNLHDALAGAYPVIKQLVGDDFFRFLARKFIDQYPSRSANLHHYGAELADFVANFPPAQELVYLSDVSALEWACHVAYFVPDTAILDLGRLTQVLPEQYPGLILHMHPACQVVRSRYPISAIWLAHQAGAESDFQIDLDSGPCIALVSRTENVVQICELSEAEDDWLQRIQTGNTLGNSTAATLMHYPVFDLQATLLKLLAHSALVDFTPGETI
jgi:hypothetical protein